VWRADIDGLRLTFHLAGINNQNFLMRDDQTGTYWQQITGKALSGPLAGRQLVLVPSDELTFALWKTEEPHGTVLQDAPAYVADYASTDWDVQMSKVPTVLSFARPGLAPRDIMIGLHLPGFSRAYHYDALLKEKLVEDQMGPEPVMLVVGPDNQSVRAFHRRIPGVARIPQFYRIEKGTVLLIDDTSGSQWDFRGCAISGKSQSLCLDRIEAIKDYWFDWRNYNPSTTVYSAPRQ
jgi:hypothetical protein